MFAIHQKSVQFCYCTYTSYYAPGLTGSLLMMCECVCVCVCVCVRAYVHLINNGMVAHNIMSDYDCAQNQIAYTHKLSLLLHIHPPSQIPPAWLSGRQMMVRCMEY